MQLQFNKTEIRFLETVLQQERHVEVSQELRLPDGMPDVGRVLTTWGQVLIRSKQWQGDSIQLAGGVMLWTLYAPEDGTEVRSIDSWIPFQISWTLPEDKREGPMRMMPLLNFADSRSISARKLMLRAGVSAMVQALSPMDAEIYTPSELPEDIQLLKRKYPMMIPVEGGEKTFLVDEEVNLPDVGSEAQKLLSLTVCPEITEKRVMSDKAVFKGMLVIQPVCRYEDGQIRSAELTVPFSQISDLDSSYGTDAQVDIRMAVTSMEFEMPKPGVIRLKCGLVAQHLVDDLNLLELVQDAYSPHRDVQIEETMLQIPVILDDRVEYIQAEQTIPGQTGQIADARFLPEYPKQRKSGNGVDLELPGRFQVLSYGDEGSLQGTSAHWEGNMQLCADNSCNPLVTVRPAGRVQAMTSMDGTNLSSQLQLSIQTGKMETIPMVTALEAGPLQEPDMSRPSVILAKGSGEPLWDLAKQSHSTVSAICSANGIEGETAPNRMLLIPVI